MDMSGQYANTFGGIGGQFGDINTNARMFGDTDMSQYMDPYTQNVTDIAAREALKFGDTQRSELGSRAAAAGAFGGYRHGLQESGIDQGVRQQVGDIKTKGLQDAFNRGIGLFEGDRGAMQAANSQRMQALQGGLGAYGQGLGAQQFGYGFGQQALGGQANVYGQMGNLGMGLGSLGQQEQNMAFDRWGNLESSGTRNRALNQTGLDMGYEDFLNQQQYPQQQLSWMSSILNGFPSQGMNTTQNTAQNRPGAFQSMLGTGISGLGLWNSMQNNRNNQQFSPW
jgi:hypothetical protein